MLPQTDSPAMNVHRLAIRQLLRAYRASDIELQDAASAILRHARAITQPALAASGSREGDYRSRVDIVADIRRRHPGHHPWPEPHPE